MPDPIPGPGPGSERPSTEAAGRDGPTWAWVPGSAEAGPVPEYRRPGPQPGSVGADGLDYGALLEALAAAGMLDGDPDARDAELAAEADGRLEPADPARVAALAVEHMDPGAAQARWLEVAAAGMRTLDENALAGVAIAARRLASRAAACELAAVAQITSRAAAADPKISVEADGRPVRVCRDALGQVALALTLTHYGAEARADLAVTLTWRLSATGRALAAGLLDLDRAQLIAEATSVLSEQQAQAVERIVLPAAGQLTRSQLRERLTRAVIAADPEGAERRRQAAERNADVRLYSDPDGTATLTGSKLSAVHAAAAMARITAIARAMRAAGQAGSLDLHRARVMLGLLLGTLPYIPPADGAPPDGTLDDGTPPGPPEPRDAGPGGHDAPGSGAAGPPPGPADGDGPGHAGRGSAAAHGHGANGPGTRGPADGGSWNDLPPLGDEDAPPDDGLDDGPDAGRGWDPAEENDLCPARPVPDWPALGAIPPALARPGIRPDDGRPVSGLLDAVIPWATLAGLADRPGMLGPVGAITAAQARLLGRAAEHDPAAQWRVIVTNAAGQAIAVTRIRRPRGREQTRLPVTSRDGPPPRADPRNAWPPGTGPPGAGLVGRVTLTITQATITASQQASGPKRAARGGSSTSARSGALSPIVGAALRSAARALQRALAQTAADQAAGGCAHVGESPAYRPPPRLREFVTARDLTCRSPVCRQPAWRADLDHTRPYDQQGRTCRCNLGGGCRRDHQLKQHPRWMLQQTRPGYFTWTTPAGRTYTIGPDTYPV